MSTALRILLAAVVVACFTTCSKGQPLPTDPALVTGELENGLHYIVRKNSLPPGRAVVWVHMHTGSLNETDRQRGIAHYLEHMAFNGSENFAPGSLVPFFQALGMTFGRDQNAFTNFDQTTFQLTLPSADADTLGKGMTFFADVVSRLSLLPKEIDDERQIILEERRRGLSGRQRTGDYIRERIAPGSIYAVREPIGREETIKGVNQQDFKDYYGKWYSASNATLIVVADAEPAQVVAVIKDKFASAPKRPRPTPQALNVKAYDRSFAIVATDPEVRSEDVRIERLGPAEPPITTVPQYRDRLVLRLGEMALNRRLSDKAAAGGTAYASARASAGNEAEAVHTATISARASAGKWKESLEQIALELQRARAFGFTARDIQDGVKELLSGAERAVETEATAQSSAFVAEINSNVSLGEPTMSAQQRLDLLRRIAPAITPEEVSKRFATEFDPKAVAFVAVLPTGGDAPTEAQLLEIGTNALAVTPTRESETVHATTLLAELPKGGAVKEGSEHTGTKVWSGWLDNGVRLHYRFMDQRKNEVSVRIALLGGELLETDDNRGITQAAQLAWSRAATRKLSSSDIRELMTGKKISVRGGGGFGGFGGGGRGRGGGGGGGSSDAISLTIAGSPEELETGFQLAYLLLTEPRIEPASFTQFQTDFRETLQESLKNPSRLGARLAAAAPYPDDEPRTRPLTADQVDRLTLQGSQGWLDRLLKDSPIEVVIIGDIDREKAVSLATKYLGSLPSRDRIAPTTFAAQRKLKRPAGPRIVEQTIQTPTQQAYVLSGFYGADEANVADSRLLSMAARVLSTRMVKEVREEGQLVYSIGAGSRPAATYPGFGVFSAAAPTDPAKVPALVAKLKEMYKAFAAEGPTDDELAVAKRQMAKTLEDEMRDPGFWSRRLEQITFRGASLDDILNENDAFQAMSTTQVKQTFAKYYSDQNSIIVVVKPGATDASSGSGSGGR